MKYWVIGITAALTLLVAAPPRAPEPVPGSAYASAAAP